MTPCGTGTLAGKLASDSDEQSVNNVGLPGI